jgi:hypothetical protein
VREPCLSALCTAAWRLQCRVAVSCLSYPVCPVNDCPRTDAPADPSSRNTMLYRSVLTSLHLMCTVLVVVVLRHIVHLFSSGVLAGLDNTGWALMSALSSTFVGMLLDWGNCEQEGASGPMSLADLESCDMAWRTAFGLAALLYLAQGGIFVWWGSSEPLKIPGQEGEGAGALSTDAADAGSATAAASGGNSVETL